MSSLTKQHLFYTFSLFSNKKRRTITEHLCLFKKSKCDIFFTLSGSSNFNSLDLVIVNLKFKYEKNNFSIVYVY